MSTDRSPSSGANGTAPGPIPDYESAIASLRRRLPAGDDARAPAATHHPGGDPAPAPAEPPGGAPPDPDGRPRRSPVGLRLALGALAVGTLVVATILGLDGSGSGGRTGPSGTERRREQQTSPPANRAEPGSQTAGASDAASPPGNASPSPDAPRARAAAVLEVQSGAAGAGRHELPSTPRPSASSDPSGTGEPGALAPAERRYLRRRLMRACEEERYAAGVPAGRRLREHDALDWGATLCFASALRNVGAAAEAVATYRTFLERYPDNRHVKEAREALAELTSGGPAGAGSVRAP